MLTKYAVLTDFITQWADQPFAKVAHRASFDYDPKPGFLYVRSRAISSRTNDNFDTFPAKEIEKGWRSFIGKPVFVNHNNENHRRARGVIVDAVLHKDSNKDGSPDTWVEVLMEVDAINFPKLAEAIVKGEIERTSMGTDVQYSLCSFCGNKAATPMDYCPHIPRLKGKRIRRRTASGSTEDVLVSEICYGLAFFENSLLVEEPADPTAYFLGVDTRGLLRSDASLHGTADIGSSELRSVHAPVQGNARVASHGTGGSGGRRSVHRHDQEGARMSFGGKRVTAVRKHAYGEIVAPPQVDTLAPSKCPICGTEEGFNGDECAVCGYLKPPEMFMDPDLEMASQTDLRQDQKDHDIGADMLEQTDPNALLECDVCGHAVPDADGVTPGMDGQPPQPSTQGQPPATPQPPTPGTMNQGPDANPPGTTPQNPAQDPQAPEDDKSTQTKPPGAELGDVPQDPPDPAGATTPPPPDNKSKDDSDTPPAGKELPKKDPAPKQDAEQDPATNPNAIDAAPDSDPNKPATQKGDDAADAQSDGNAPPANVDGGSNPPPSDTKTDPDADPSKNAPPGADSSSNDDKGGEDKSSKPNPDGSVPKDLPAAHEGDPCPSCGNGKLTKSQADAFNQEEDALASGDETEKQVAQDADGAHFPGDDTSSGDGSTPPTGDSGDSNDTDSADDSKDDEDEDPNKPKVQPWQKDDKSKQGVKSTPTQGAPSKMAPRPVMQAVAEQQKWLERQQSQINTIAKLAGITFTADEKNPADPIPSPGAEAPYSTLEEERNSATQGDVAAIGGVPGETDVAADSTTTVDAIGGINADTPYNISEDVTKPTDGTDGHRPTEETITRPEIQFGNPLKPDAAFPLQGEWASKATVGSAARSFASLRLARLRIQAGIEQGDDAVIAQRIEADASIPDAVLAYEADTLAKVVTAGAQKQASAPAQQRRVATAANQTRAVPSVAAGAAAPSLGHTTGAVISDSEFAFE